VNSGLAIQIRGLQRFKFVSSSDSWTFELWLETPVLDVIHR